MNPACQRLLTIPSDQIAIAVISAEELIRGRLAQIRKATKPQERFMPITGSQKHWNFCKIFQCWTTMFKQKPVFNSFSPKRFGLAHKI